jgi:N-acetylglucosaminyldiphosphoundecaprenol N-acetyl-beta-D-mannosaminyltransferase
VDSSVRISVSDQGFFEASRLIQITESWVYNLQMPTDIFGLIVDDRNIAQVALEIAHRAHASDNFVVVTPNVDHFLRWQRDEDFRRLYDQAEFRLIDGVPVLWLARLMGDKVSERITGVDLSSEVIDLASQMGMALAIIGGTEEVMEIAKANLQRKYPKLDIFFTATPEHEQLSSISYQDFLAQNLGERDRKIVLFCLGSPKQEILYSQLNERHELTGGYLCVGGTIDFIANARRRAPKLLQRIGLEWFYRFAQEPVRLFKRYFCTDIVIVRYLWKACIIRIFQQR